MSTSYTRTANQVITRALRMCGAISQTETPSTEAIANALDVFNSQLKNLAADGYIQTQNQLVQVNLNQSSSEVIGTDSINYKCITNHTTSASTYPVSGSDWSLYWEMGGTNGIAFTNNVAKTSSRMISVNSDWDTIVKATWRKDNADYPLDIMQYADYLAIQDKSEESGLPDALAIEYNSSGMNIYLYPIPNDFRASSLQIWVSKLFTNMDSASTTVELKNHWIEFLTYQLAATLADEYILPLQERQWLMRKAEVLMKKCFGKSGKLGSNEFMSSAY